MKIFFTSLLPSIACPSWTMGNEEKERKEMLLLNGANPASFFGENVSRASTESLSHRWPPFFLVNSSASIFQYRNQKGGMEESNIWVLKDKL
jgi:hypothetical protein